MASALQRTGYAPLELLRARTIELPQGHASSVRFGTERQRGEPEHTRRVLTRRDPADRAANTSERGRQPGLAGRHTSWLPPRGRQIKVIVRPKMRPWPINNFVRAKDPAYVDRLGPALSAISACCAGAR